MNKRDAHLVMGRRVRDLRAQSYAELRDQWLHQADCEQIISESGVEYQVEIEAVWDDEPGTDLRVIVSIDDGGWRAFKPLVDGFIIRHGCAQRAHGVGTRWQLRRRVTGVRSESCVRGRAAGRCGTRDCVRGARSAT